LEYPVGELPQKVQTALAEAINDEYKAYSTYESVIKKFGNIRPFSMIIRAEEQHISSLKAVYDKYGLTAPTNSLSGTITAPTTLQQLVKPELRLRLLMLLCIRIKLLPVVARLTRHYCVFTTLMNASQQNIFLLLKNVIKLSRLNS
jgi:hypothetical protein